MDGKCACFQGWTGAHCNVSATANECSADADCGAGRMCDGATRMCYCAGGYGGEECKSCGCGATGGDTCAATCDVDATCSSNGRYVFKATARMYVETYIHTYVLLCCMFVRVCLCTCVK